MKIGYQGNENSFNHLAAKDFASKLNLSSYELIPLGNSQHVVKALLAKEISYGVVAIQNSIAGIVRESYEALKTESFEFCGTSILQINHCLFTKKDVSKENIKHIASHEMALKQCQIYIKSNFPNSNEIAVGDTAMAATQLAINKLEANTAVICSKEAGLGNGLQLVAENIQDTTENYTEFRLFKVREYDDNISIFNRILTLFYGDENKEIIFKFIISVLIFSLFLLYGYFYKYMNPVGAAWTFGGAITTLFLVISNKKIRNRFYFNFIKGYWTYQVVMDDNQPSPEKNYQIPRVVEIYEEKGELKFSIYIADKPSREFAKSTKILHSTFGLETGDIVYWYEVSDINTARFNFKGIVYMYWQNKKKWRKITQLTARYLGEVTKEQGFVNYHRISKTEFDTIRNSKYLSF